MRVLALLTICACARTGHYTAGWYEDCMKRLEAPERGNVGWQEIDALCRKRARQLQFEGPDATTICKDTESGRVCHTYDNTK